MIEGPSTEGELFALTPVSEASAHHSREGTAAHIMATRKQREEDGERHGEGHCPKTYKLSPHLLPPSRLYLDPGGKNWSRTPLVSIWGWLRLLNGLSHRRITSILASVITWHPPCVPFVCFRPSFPFPVKTLAMLSKNLHCSGLLDYSYTSHLIKAFLRNFNHSNYLGHFKTGLWSLRPVINP